MSARLGRLSREPSTPGCGGTLAARSCRCSIDAGRSLRQSTPASMPGTDCHAADRARPDRVNGDIIVSAQISWNTSATLTLIAFRNIQINDAGPCSRNNRQYRGAAGKLVMRADSTGTGVGTIVMPAGTTSHRVNWTGSTGTITVYYNPSVFGTPNNFTTGNGFHRISASPGQLTAYMLVNTATNLQNISTNLCRHLRARQRHQRHRHPELRAARQHLADAVHRHPRWHEPGRWALHHQQSDDRADSAGSAMSACSASSAPPASCAI